MIEGDDGGRTRSGCSWKGKAQHHHHPVEFKPSRKKRPPDGDRNGGDQQDACDVNVTLKTIKMKCIASASVDAHSFPSDVCYCNTKKRKQVNAGKNSRSGSHGKIEEQCSPPDDNNLNNLSLTKKDPKKKKKTANSMGKHSDFTQKTTQLGIISRSMEKENVRNKIKDVILNAGWKIELKLRRSRNYNDSIYVSPQGTGYWSITKAYAVFLKQCQQPEPEASLERNSKKMSGSSSFSSAAIPDHVLSILKRNTVKKRSKRKGIEKPEKECRPNKMSTKDVAVCVKSKSFENGVVGLKLPSHSSGHLPKGRIKNRRTCKLLVRPSHQEGGHQNYNLCNGKRTLLTWMIDSGALAENGIVNYRNKKNMQPPLLKGQITRDGIHCYCCGKMFPISKFEIHSGSKLRQPYRNIFLEETGSSLLECLVAAWENQKEFDRFGFSSVDVNGDDPNDDTCGICGDGGDLICCDGCPSTFHLCCLGIKMLPQGDWLCSNCSCRFCGMVKSKYSLDDSCSSPQLLSCNQCEIKYHEGCVRKVDDCNDCSISCTSFCGKSCKQIFEQLQKLLGVKNMLEDGFSWSVVHQVDVDLLTSSCEPVQSVECNAKVAVAFSVMDECFLPIIDQRSGVNTIHNIVHNRGSNFNRLNYGRFYTFLLEKEDEIISAASIRIHGARFAEMPFIGTRYMHRRKGMCRRLLNAIEMALSSIGVGKLVIPAISQLLQTWTAVFNFNPIDDLLKQELKSRNVLVFPGTGLLEKTLIKQEDFPSTTGDCNVAETQRNVDLPMVANIAEVNKISHNHSFEAKDETLDSVAVADGSDGPCHSDIHVIQCPPLVESTAEMACSLDSDMNYNAPGIEIDSHFNCSTGCQISSPCANINQNTTQFKIMDLDPNEFMVGDGQLAMLSRNHHISFG